MAISFARPSSPQSPCAFGELNRMRIHSTTHLVEGKSCLTFLKLDSFLILDFVASLQVVIQICGVVLWCRHRRKTQHVLSAQHVPRNVGKN